jgi:signal transduction histidine kinase
VNLQPEELNAMCRKACPLISTVIGNRVEFQFHPCEGALTVKADVFQMEQVLLNLSTNARDAMPDGGTLTLTTSRVLTGQAVPEGYPGNMQSYAKVSISDTGIGMDEETRGRIFEPFYTTKEPGRGTGLGLSIVYGIIQQHAGYIEVRSTRGVETVFDIYLPLLEAASEGGSAGEGS